jgi:hypothetical protein
LLWALSLIGNADMHPATCPSRIMDGHTPGAGLT